MPAHNPPQPPRRLGVALGTAGLIALLIGGGTIAWYWFDGLPYDATSGVWLALAQDWSRGILYRPLAGTLGFGGTRYMPLFFMTLGSLVHAGADIVVAGIALTTLSLALLLAAVFSVMRRLGVATHIALSCTALLLSSITIQLLGIAVKGDLLAAAFDVWGFYFALGSFGAEMRRRQCRRAARKRRTPARPRVSLMLAIVCWVLAFATKLTALSGAVAFTAWLLYACEWRRAARVAGWLTLGCVAVVFACNAWSHGAMVTSFAAVASGGAHAGYAWLAPVWMLRAIGTDPFLAVLVTAGTVSAAAWLRRSGRGMTTTPSAAIDQDPRRHALMLWLAVTALVTLLIFASPGTDANHLVELVAVSTIIAGVQLHRRPPRHAVAAIITYAFATALTILPGVPSVAHFFATSGRPTRQGIQRLRTTLGDRVQRPALSENPLIPILLGRTPEVLDPFSLRLLAARDTVAEKEFRRRMANGYYGSVILVDWSGSDGIAVRSSIDAHTSPGVTDFYGEMNFPEHFLEDLWRYYSVAATPHPFVVFVPR